MPGKLNNIQIRLVVNLANEVLRKNFTTCEPNQTSKTLFQR